MAPSPMPSAPKAPERPTDPHVVVVGGGLVGLTAALAFAGAGGLRVTVLDAAEAPRTGDGRTTALAPATVRMLDALGVWPSVAPFAEPILRMTLTDSDLETPARPALLSFGIDAGENEAAAPLAHMAANTALFSALTDAAREAGVVWRSARVGGLIESGVTLEGDETLAADLVVAADGVRSSLRRMAGLKTVERDYAQTALVGTVAHARPHGGEAVQHFLPGGPFAMLPLQSVDQGMDEGTDEHPHRTSIVWSEEAGEAERVLGLDRPAQAVELTRRFGYRWGAPSLVGDLAAYPLRLRLARDLVAPGLALVGDAAHVIHPIAGQGFNLGAKDVAALVETVVAARRTGGEIGSLAVLGGYQRWRRADVALMAGLTDGLNRLFSNDAPVLRAARAFGLRLVERTPRLKARLATAASGEAGDTPRLLDGLPV